MSRWRILVASMALLVLTGCNVVDTLTSTVVPTQISFAEATGPTAGLPTISGSGGLLIVEGAIHLPDPCYSLTGHTSLDGQNLSVVVEAQPMPAALCIAMLSTKRYSLSAGPVPTGSYQVTLTHRVANGSASSDSLITQAVTTIP